MFCPFIKGDCESECVFYNNCYNYNNPESCKIYEAVDMIGSFGFEETRLSDYIENIDSNVFKTSENTGIDQTESPYINSRLSSIENMLDEIKDKLK